MSRKRLRVLYIESSVGFGGAIKSIGLTLRRIPDVEALVVTSQDPDLVETWLGGLEVRPFRRTINYRTAERFSRWVRDRVPTRALRWLLLRGRTATELAVTAKNTVWLTWLIRRRRIDLVHLNNGLLPPEAILAARLAGVPCLGHLRGFAGGPEVRPQELLPWISHVVAVSDAVAEQFRGDAPVPADWITVIHDPVDLELVARARGERDRTRAKLGLEPHHVAVGIFGRVVRWKGQLEFVHAAIRAMRVAPDLRAVIVGDESDGGREYFDEVRDAIRASGLESRFLLPGYAADVEAYYAAVDVVVHASIEPEPFGMVVPEAMASQRAVIAADEGGPREVVTHGVDGILVPPGDVERMAEAIVRLATDPAERRRLAANAARTAHAQFSIETNAERVRAVYDRVVPGSGPSGRVRRPERPAAAGRAPTR